MPTHRFCPLGQPLRRSAPDIQVLAQNAEYSITSMIGDALLFYHIIDKSATIENDDNLCSLFQGNLV